MSEERVIRINRVLREFNISLERAVDYLKDKGIVIDANPNAKISDHEYGILQDQFAIAQSAIERQGHHVTAKAELSENPAEKLEYTINQMTLDDEVERRLKALVNVDN